MAAPDSRLHRSLRLWQLVASGVGIVVGAGALALGAGTFAVFVRPRLAER